jgi:hypothetical protein
MTVAAMQMADIHVCGLAREEEVQEQIRRGNSYLDFRINLALTVKLYSTINQSSEI